MSMRGGGGGGRAAFSGGGNFRGGMMSGARQFNSGGARQFSGTRQFSGVRNFNNGGIRHFNGNGVRHFARHHHRFRGPVVFGSPFFYDYGYNYGYSGDDCYQWQPTMTRYGWRNMWVNVCYGY